MIWLLSPKCYYKWSPRQGQVDTFPHGNIFPTHQCQHTHKCTHAFLWRPEVNGCCNRGLHCVAILAWWSAVPLSKEGVGSLGIQRSCHTVTHSGGYHKLASSLRCMFLFAGDHTHLGMHMYFNAIAQNKKRNKAMKWFLLLCLFLISI